MYTLATTRYFGGMSYFFFFFCDAAHTQGFVYLYLLRNFIFRVVVMADALET